MTPLPKSRRSTVSDTDTSKPEHLISPPLPAARIQTRRRARRRAFPLTVRILAVNILALGILLAGLLYLDRYQRDLMDAKLNAMEREATLLASALGEGLVSQRQVNAALPESEVAAGLLQRLTMPDTTALLFDQNGALLVDSRALPGARLSTNELPPPDSSGWLGRAAIDTYDWLAQHLPPRTTVPTFDEPEMQNASAYPVARQALEGEAAGVINQTPEGGLIALVAVPIQPLRRVQGVLLVWASADDVVRQVRDGRFTILQAFGIALSVTILLSLYFAGTIARPVRRLAEAAERVRAGQGRKVEIPDFTARNDEIGGLSAALRDMTDALWVRMDAIERFVADVVHEIKNPLGSLRSAVETARRLDDPAKRDQLLDIVAEDVKRLDRLLSEIADASKLDTELSRLPFVPVDVTAMLETLAGIHNTADDGRVQLAGDVETPAMVLAVQDRLAQVFQNVLSNARSFSPPGGTITLTMHRIGEALTVEVDDDGPGIPEGTNEAIFERFYTLRAEGEPFGTHSGLGLSISRQIVEAHGGTVVARNRTDGLGQVQGTRITITLPTTTETP